LKIIDFGMAKQFGPIVQHSKNNITLCYRPPEMILGTWYYGPSADMWSVGCILAELIMRQPLFPGHNQLD
jgi:serine/threonine protein kinase